MADAIALIIAGSGEATEDEVVDLLADAYPEDKFEEIGVVVPVDKDLFTKTVQHVVAWFNDDKALYTIQTEGASLSRASSKLGDGTQKVSKFSDILTKEEFQDWDDVHFLVALPEDEEDADYDKYAEMVEVAIENGLTVKNLARALDDVTLADPDPEPEPEPEPEEKPKRTSRRRGKPEEKAEEPEPEAKDEKPAPKRSRSRKAPEKEDPADVHDEVALAAQGTAKVNGDDTRIASLESRVEALEDTINLLRTALNSDQPAPKGDEEPKRGRGRPRTNFEVKQVWDEDDEEWIPRPAGRLRKGTKWRTIHAETDEVLEEGTA